MNDEELEAERALLKAEIDKAIAYAMTLAPKQCCEALERINKAIFDANNGIAWFAKGIGIKGISK